MPCLNLDLFSGSTGYKARSSSEENSSSPTSRTTTFEWQTMLATWEPVPTRSNHVQPNYEDGASDDPALTVMISTANTI